jgi:hypothetical protein
MRKFLRISSILSWINLVFWGLISLIGLLSGFSSGSFVLILWFFLQSSIVLHSYAAIRLHTSIRRPAIPLSGQTPSGIRFVGFVAMFFGVAYFAYGVALLRSAKEILQTIQSSMPQFKDIKEGDLHAGGVIALLLGLSITVNVILNLRLLRWYYLSRENKGDQ